MFNKNYFVDGEQLLRQLSPGTPSRSDDQMKSLMSAGATNSAAAPRQGRKSTSNRKTSKSKNKEVKSMIAHKTSSENVLSLNLTNKSIKAQKAQKKNA